MHEILREYQGSCLSHEHAGATYEMGTPCIAFHRFLLRQGGIASTVHRELFLYAASLDCCLRPLCLRPYCSLILMSPTVPSVSIVDHPPSSRPVLLPHLFLPRLLDFRRVPQMFSGSVLSRLLFSVPFRKQFLTFFACASQEFLVVPFVSSLLGSPQPRFRLRGSLLAVSQHPPGSRFVASSLYLFFLCALVVPENRTILRPACHRQISG
mmetsp:Transcript_5007/g.10504  ORF Transcript_5007/g.10504 Transcript_5007/m.10504 type:complete len:210 (-) Transcript_5007:406-1035(-)